MVVSAYLDLPPGATIVLVALAGFVATSPVGLLLQRRRRARVPFDPEALPLHEEAVEAHRHVHGPGCGHVAVEHGDHVDYVHDGHRHAVHVTGEGSTMTSTEPNWAAGRAPPHAPTAGRPRRADRRRGLPLRAGGPRAARGARLRRRPGHRLPHAALYADHGLVDVLRREDGEAIYRRCSDTHHHHLVCRSCGATVEVEGPAVEKWTSAIATEHGFSDLSHTLEIVGTCADCRGH